ncbi:MAG TPA: DUF6310 domain-containing protein [Archangium sp.]|uniref:DUF6310 domain-containing protein n=1 Tax=Archangium sp. TaxID=1872627 RepID=UPI002E3602E5|nr:DUF6310 domain-containing protein [Archangium sp.]HEX5747464.1 DUF6310 domain-containing protein [Archangium sp.]
MLAERCFHALDHDRIEFHDITGRCAVASAGAGAGAMGLGVCVLAAPELVVGAVVVAGVVVVGFAIKEALDTYAKKRGRPQVRPMPETRPVPETKPAPPKPSPKKRPKPEPKGPDFPPLEPPETSERERRRCEPDPVPYHLGGNPLHDTCADRIPNNSFPGGDVFVNGKNFDALQLATRTLWEVKTDNFDKFTPDLRRIVLDNQVLDLQYERGLALACGFNFRVGVRSPAHRIALELAEPELAGIIEVMEWC